MKLLIFLIDFEIFKVFEGVKGCEKTLDMLKNF